MPILPEEPSIFPHDLLDHVPDHCQWWAMYTKARQEKAFARELLHREIRFYLPLLAQDRFIRGHRVTSHIPLFGGYVFVCGSDEERVQALRTNRISRVLPVPDPIRLWHDLRQIKRLIEADAPLTLERRLEAGQRVRIRSGPFTDVEGTVLRRQGKHRLVVAVEFLQQGVSLELEDVRLEPI